MSSTPPPESSGDKLKRLAASEAQTEKPAKEAHAKPVDATTPASESTAETSSADSEPLHTSGEPGLGPGWYRHEADNLPNLRKVAIDADGMPRPSKTPETERRGPRAPEQTLNAAHMQENAVQPPESTYPAGEFDAAGLAQRPVAPPRRGGWRGCLRRALLFGLLGLGLVVLAVGGAAAYGYWSIARTLPKVDDLRSRASQFETTRVYDAKGNLLYEIVDPQAGRRTRVPLSKVSPYLLAATIATEDKDFYSHPGFDPLAILRALRQNLESGETVSGASTITQQLVRALVLTPDERAQRSAMRKIREIILAAEITRTYSKDEILELYLNEIYYGNLAYGIEAASETYFHKPANDLDLAEAAFLAGLPQSPSVYDVFTNHDAALNRQQQVLGLMLSLGCVPVSTRTEPVCVRVDDVQRALLELENYSFTQPKSGARFPHWVNYIRRLLEDQYGAQTIYRSGFSVYTTLDPDLQTIAESAVAEQIATLADKHVTDGALVALRPTTGEIVAMVGSENYDDPVDGQINMALRPRQPGSSIKPLTYALAFEKGWTPATLIWDVPTEFPDGSNPPYKPVNYDGRFHGPVLVRSALANSYNIPAVKTLQVVGIYGEAGFVQFAEKLGITSLDRKDYGLSLTLGGGEVPLLQMVGAFGALADGGTRVFPIAILKITDASGKATCQQPLTPSDLKTDPPPCQTPPENWGRPVISPETAFLIGDILADNNARTPAFGPNSPLQLSFPVAVKTGTTNDFRDNWTIGYTPDLVAGVWVGNADFTPMLHTTGVTGAAPIWHTFMERALAGQATPFSRPQGIIEKTICGVSGTEPSDLCPPDSIRTELFSATDGPLPKERDLRQRAFVDPFTGLRQSADCAKYYQSELVYAQEKTVVNVTDPWAQSWLTQDPNGQAWAAAHGLTPPLIWAPDVDCTADSPHPIISFAYPPEGATLTDGVIQISGQAAATKDFDHFIIEYGLSRDPQGWGSVLGLNTNPSPDTARLADFDLNPLPDGPVTLRIVVFSKSGGSAEARVHFSLQHPTPVPTATSPPTATPTSTSTATLTPSATPTPVPTATPPPSDTPTPTATPVPSDTPTTTPALTTTP